MNDEPPDRPSPEDQSTESTASSSEAPSRIGPYRILQKIGEGGMGVVYEAEQEKPVRRRVALKVIKHGMDTKAVIARFEAERQALALMNHSNVAKVFDAGATEQGRPYFAMELVKGVPITEHCDRQRLNTRERLELFTQVCEGVQHAHQKAIIHRDIKPSNILVQVEGDNRVPKIIDFGVAKATAQRLTERTLFTEQGVMIGTPEYMSPEQAEMTGEDIDTRTDVYSLGVVLYELLVGALPFDPKELREAGFGEIRRKIREDEPSKPSTRLSTLGEGSSESAKKRRTDPTALARQLRGDLDWITMRALEKDRTRRYGSPNELAADINRHLEHEPVVASPPSTAYRMGKFVRKHRGPVFATTTVVVTALLLGSIAFWQGRTAQRRALHIREQAERLRAHSILASARAAEDPVLKALLLIELADLPETPGRLRVARDTANSPLPRLTLQNRHAANIVAFNPNGTQVLVGVSDEPARLWQVDGGEVKTLAGCDSAATSASFDAEGTRVAVGFLDGRVGIWRTDGVGEPVILNGHRDDDTTFGLDPAVLGVSFDPAGLRLVTASSAGMVRIWSLDGTADPVAIELNSTTPLSPKNCSFSSDGKRLLTVELTRAHVRNASGAGEPVALGPLPGEDWELSSASFTPGGQRVLTCSRHGDVRVWNADGSGEPVVLQRGTPDVPGYEPYFWVHKAPFSPDGTRVLIASLDGTARILPVDGSGEPVVLRGHKSWLTQAAFSPDGAHVVTTSSDGTARLWRADGTGTPVVLNQGHGWVRDAAFHPDGKQVVTAGDDGTVQLWQIDELGESLVLEHPDGVTSGSFDEEGRHILTLSNDGSARVWRTDRKEAPIVLRVAGGDVTSTVFGADGTHVVTASRDGSVRVWRSDGVGSPVILRSPEDDVFAITMSDDGSRVATEYRRRATIWNTRGDSDSFDLSGYDPRGYTCYDDDEYEREVSCATIAFSDDGNALAAGFTNGSVLLWRGDGSGHSVALEVETPIWSVAFSPDGARLVAATVGRAYLWNTDGSGEPTVFALADALYFYSHASFSFDGSRVLTTDARSAQIWNADGTGDPITLPSLSMLKHASFSPDATRVVTASSDGAARVWAADGTGEPLVLRGHESKLTSASFSPDGTRVLTTSEDGTARIWRTTWDELLSFLRDRVTVCLSPDQRMEFLAETDANAWNGFAACERQHGREPRSPDSH